VANVSLHHFIDTHRDELVARCAANVATRAVARTTAEGTNHGVPLFLDHLLNELCGEQSQDDIAKGATAHGRDLLYQGFTVSQVVHDYGDICQSITDLALETDALIGTEDFCILNRCLADAIASAVTEHAHGQAAIRNGEAQDMRFLLHHAIRAFEMLQEGHVGVGGSTGTVLRRYLASMSAFINRPKLGAA
jgi:hypothetical protein